MLTFRKATQEDANMLFALRNDPITRESFIHTALVPYKCHIKWLTSSLGSPNRALLIVEDQGMPVGLIKRDMRDAKAELSWTVNPVVRGKGYGSLMITACLEQYTGEVIAFVKDFNLASLRICEKAGFKQVRRDKAEGLIYFNRPAIIVESR